MNSRILLPLFLVLLIPVGHLAGQQAPAASNQPDPVTLARLQRSTRIKNMTKADLEAITAKAEAGDAEAQYWLGSKQIMLLGKAPKPENLLQVANRWILKSAEQGYAPAQSLYGGIYAHIADASVGEQWMVRAAEQGDPEAEFALGLAYDNKTFGTKNPEQATKWYRRAAEAGHPDAQVFLGREYEDGDGVPQSYQLAAFWYRQAAEHFPDLGGAGQGRNNLGLLYLEGLGVPQSYADAYFWFSLKVSDANTADAKEHLAPAEIAETDRRVREWQEQHKLGADLSAKLHFEN
jgi:TPR repeat protein